MAYKIFIVLIFSISSLFAQGDIEVYNCYGNETTIWIDARTVATKPFKQTDISSGKLENLWTNGRYFRNSESKEQFIQIYFLGERFETKSDDEGFFTYTFSPKQKVNGGIHTLTINDTTKVNCHIIETQWSFSGIISDFDDTVIVSDVTNKLKLINNTFFKNHTQREVILGMKEKFTSILANNPPSTPNILFIVSASPNQLNKSIHHFLDYNNFPQRTIITKKAHGENSEPLLDQVSYKSTKISRLIELYPNIQWTLFGDNGEKDTEIYTNLYHRYKKHIHQIYIRNVTTGQIDSILPLITK